MTDNFQKFFNSHQDWFWVIDRHKNIIDLNPSFTNSLGYIKDELIGKSIFSICPEPARVVFEDKIDLCCSDNPICFDSFIISKQGENIRVESTVVAGDWNEEAAVLGVSRNQNPLFLSNDKYCQFVQKNPLISDEDLKKSKFIVHEGRKNFGQLFEDYYLKYKEERRDRQNFEKDISKKNILLAEKNITLKQLLDQREKEKQEIRDEINQKVQHLILPLISRIQTNGTESDKRYLSALIHNLNEIVVPTSQVAKRMSILSSRELEICNLIIQGCNSKDIAEMLCLSIQTVNTHRKNIRKKLGINSSRVNLSTYLKSDIKG